MDNVALQLLAGAARADTTVRTQPWVAGLPNLAPSIFSTSWHTNALPQPRPLRVTPPRLSHQMEQSHPLTPWFHPAVVSSPAPPAPFKPILPAAHDLCRGAFQLAPPDGVAPAQPLWQPDSSLLLDARIYVSSSTVLTSQPHLPPLYTERRNSVTPKPAPAWP